MLSTIVHRCMGRGWYHHFFFGFQPASCTGRTRALSSFRGFASSPERQVECFSLLLHHISNGSPHQLSLGKTMVLPGLWFGW